MCEAKYVPSSVFIDRYGQRVISRGYTEIGGIRIEDDIIVYDRKEHPMTEISEKEVEAAREAWREYWCEEDVPRNTRDGMTAALEAAARVRAEANAEEATRAEAAAARVKELEAENARLRERQAEADRAIDRLKLALQAERQKPMRCAACNGDGQVSRSYGYIPCDACNGRGF